MSSTCVAGFLLLFCFFSSKRDNKHVRKHKNIFKKIKKKNKQNSSMTKDRYFGLLGFSFLLIHLPGALAATLSWAFFVQGTVGHTHPSKQLQNNNRNRKRKTKTSGKKKKQKEKVAHQDLPWFFLLQIFWESDSSLGLQGPKRRMRIFSALRAPNVVFSDSSKSPLWHYDWTGDWYPWILLGNCFLSLFRSVFAWF